MDGLQADKSAVATLPKTKELKKAFMGLERVVTSVLEAVLRSLTGLVSAVNLSSLLFD